ncbi:MAG: hypothetical protein RII27_03750 [Alphaproteobacteria bacterium]
MALLMGALHDLDDGILSPMLTPTTFGNRPPSALNTQAVRAHAAINMEWLMQLGCNANDAAKQVAAALSAGGFRSRQKKGPAPATVADWRHRLKKGQGTEIECETFHDLEKGMSIEVPDGSETSVLRRNLLKKLEQLVRDARVGN